MILFLFMFNVITLAPCTCAQEGFHRQCHLSSQATPQPLPLSITTLPSQQKPTLTTHKAMHRMLMQHAMSKQRCDAHELHCNPLHPCVGDSWPGLSEESACSVKDWRALSTWQRRCVKTLKPGGALTCRNPTMCLGHERDKEHHTEKKCAAATGAHEHPESDLGGLFQLRLSGSLAAKGCIV